MQKSGSLFFETRHTGDVDIWRSSRLEFPKHIHSNIELCIILKGRITALAENRGGILSEGHAFIAFPNQVHSFKNEFGPADAVVAIIKSGFLPDFSGIFSGYLPKSPIVPIDLKLLLPLINIVFSSKENPTPYTDTVVKGCVSIILSHILENTELKERSKRDITAIQSVLIYCADNYKKEFSLDAMAEALHLNKYYISHIFKKEVGMTLPEYINSLRISDAERLVANSDMSITDIAFKVGFGSIRSFNRQFAALTGSSPSSFRIKSVSNKSDFIG